MYCCTAQVPVDYVLGVGGFELDTVEKQLAAVMKVCVAYAGKVV